MNKGLLSLMSPGWLQVIVRKRDQSQTLGISWFTTSQLLISTWLTSLEKRFPPLSIEVGRAPFPTIPAIIGILLKVACLPSHPLEKLVARKEAV